MKTNLQLIEYAKAQIGKPYWWGTYGQKSDKVLLAAKRRQYPSQYKDKDFEKQYGQRVHDCSGLIKGYLMSETFTSTPKYDKSYDLSADGYLRKASVKGPINTMPETPGMLVHYPGHIGVYIGNGLVVEAKGHKYGVIQSKLAQGGWKSWSRCPFITYINQTSPSVGGFDMTPDDIKEVQQYLNVKLGNVLLGKLLTIDGSAGPRTKEALVKYWQKTVGGLAVDGSFGPISKNKASKNNLVKGSNGELVKVMQMALICKNYLLASYGADGSFGNYTKAVLEEFQRANGLEFDGICGKNTWIKLLS